MKKITLASMALAALMVSPTFAADLPRKAPPPVVPAPVYTWTGCYIGANIGWVKAETSVEVFGVDEFSRSRDGGAFGGQIGCDYQFATNWVIGIRGLLDGTNIEVQRQSPVLDILSWQADVSRFATITARLGYVVTPAFLIYGQVGWGVYKTNLIAFDTFSGAWFGHWSKKHSGLDLGIGAEWMFAPNWSLWIEWDHIFADDHSVFVPILGTTATVKRDLDKVLVGVNWRFGGVGGPLRAAY